MRKRETVMKMLVINPISFKKRMTEFLFDYLFILAYLVLLFLGSMLIYIIFFNGVPEFTEIQSQWLVFFTSVLPITLLFIVLSISATLLAVSLLAMTMLRKDKRHLVDLLAHTQVQLKEA